MERIKKTALMFLFGGVGYGIIELLWRGHTHITMIFAGGVCFLVFELIAKKMKDRPIWLKATLGALAVSSVELLFGIVFNLALGLDVWDYSSVPLNFLGQICLPFAFLWAGLSALCIPLADRVSSIYDRVFVNN